VGSTITLTWNVPDPDGAGPCTAATDQMNITVNNATVANAGPDQSTCGTTAVTLAANNISGGNWTGGTGTFSPNRNTANATYTPAASEIGTTITLTWNVPDPDGTGPCTAATDAMTVTVNANCCVITAGSISANQSICTNVDPALLSETAAATGSGTLTYRWERSTTSCSAGFNAIPGATSSTYDPPPGLTQTTYFRRVAINTAGSISCEAISNCVVITIISGPVVNAVSNLTYCVGATVPSVVFSSNIPGASIQWSRTAPIPDIGLIPVSAFGNVPSFIATNTTASPLVSTFTVVATNDGCAGASMHFTITVVPRTVVTLQLPFDTLNNNAGPITLNGGSPAGGTYSGTGVNSIGQLIPSSLLPGNYTVTYQYSLGAGCNGTALDRYTIIPRAARINIYPNPAPDGILTISATPEMVGAWVRVFNTAGQKVMEWKLAGRLTNYHFKWAAGIYIFDFTKENITERKLVLITR